MKEITETEYFMEEATVDVLKSIFEEIGTEHLTDKSLEESEAYIILHRDNPETSEVLGSVNINVPYPSDDEVREVLGKLNVPYERPRLTCFGVFDISKPDLGNVSLRCAIRNEHGFPISYATESLGQKTDKINRRILESLQNEIKEDVDELKGI